MREGQQIIVLGSISVYERDGKYQLYAKEIRLDGAGLLYERFLALKQELEEMGEDIAGKLDQIIPMMILTNSGIQKADPALRADTGRGDGSDGSGCA